jgi:hypothetical protein
MPEMSVIHVVLLAITTAIGAIIGWVIRGNRSREEKAAINLGKKRTWSPRRAKQRPHETG